MAGPQSRGSGFGPTGSFGPTSFSEQDEKLTNIQLRFNVPPEVQVDVTAAELILGESLLTPGLQTSLRVHSYSHNLPVKNLDVYKGSSMEIVLTRPVNSRYGINPQMRVSQITYRIDNRKMINNNTEEYVLHACDQTLLDDAATLVSKMWKCTKPSSVVSEVLSSCAGVDPGQLDVESCDPARDYIAENIHPFQVVAQQANVALAEGNDPSFLHYMTYKNYGTHHFRSLNYLTKKASICEYTFSETGQNEMSEGYANPRLIRTLSFPCDFDLLSDILNGVDINGNDINSAMLFNPVTKQFSTFGNQSLGCGIGGGNAKLGMTNQDSAGSQNACPDYAYLYMQKRQARMGLLEQDKIALRITVPWNPELHVGEIITVKLPNKKNSSILNYGSGDYLILHMTHNIKRSGYATTTMDCVSRTVGQGIV